MQKTPYYNNIACADFETYWAQDFSLTSKSMSMTEYVRDDRFEAQSLAIRMYGSEETEVAYGEDIKELIHSVDWDTTAFLAHHTHFDGLIATHHFGVEPIFWLDTMPMSRMLHGVDVNHSFAAISGRLGFPGKTKGHILQGTKGKYLAEFTDEEREVLGEYNADDCHDTLEFFKLFAPLISMDELRIIDLTTRMYCEPLLLLDEERLQQLHGREVIRRAKLVEDAGTTAAVLGSPQKFADLLRSLGVVPPMKLSPRTGNPTYAFAKTDLEFKSLLDHTDESVRKAVQARLGNKGSIVETRSKRLLQRVGLPTPVYLACAAARTLRWGGGDLCNWQNFPSTGDGANIRRAILAPDETLMICADSSQVEARMVAWLAEFIDKMEAFRLYDSGQGPDLYCVAAGGVFGRSINKTDDPFERFIGKVLELSCQYGAGAVRVKHALAQGFRGADPVFMPLLDVKANITRWRRSNKPITDLWSTLEKAAIHAWIRGTPMTVGPVSFELFKGDGYIHLPNGTFLKYPSVSWNEEKRGIRYQSRNGPTDLWGGFILENVSQALCAVLLKFHMLEITDSLPWFRMVLLVHDEIVGLSTTEQAEPYSKEIKRIMSTPASWAEGLPLNAAVSFGEYYDKA